MRTNVLHSNCSRSILKSHLHKWLRDGYRLTEVSKNSKLSINSFKTEDLLNCMQDEAVVIFISNEFKRSTIKLKHIPVDQAKEDNLGLDFFYTMKSHTNQRQLSPANVRTTSIGIR